MSVNIQIREKLPEDAVILTNHSFDNSIIGLTFDGRIIYDYDLMVEELMKDENWEENDAQEWVDYNTLRALPYGGDKTPLIVCKQ